ncbi:MAG: rod shape-determining protein MreC [Bacteroidota bacterium]
MFRLLSLLSANRNLLVFLFLEAVAFMLIVRNNDYQRHQFGDSLYNVSGWVNLRKDRVKEYFDLPVQNQKLMNENIKLQKSLLNAQNQINELQSQIDQDSLVLAGQTDSESRRDSFRFIPARVIRNSTNRNYNYITLNKGIDDSVRVGMGVVSPEGIVGKVIKVSEKYSLILSALNLSFKLQIKAVAKEDESVEGYVGVYEWDGKSTNEAIMTYIPETVSLDTGYQVVTSGYSTTFPAGYRVGKIQELDPVDGYYNIRLRLATEFHSLGNVYLVDAPHKVLLDSLEQSIPQS